jgi:hypothetical protein
MRIANWIARAPRTFVRMATRNIFFNETRRIETEAVIFALRPILPGQPGSSISLSGRQAAAAPAVRPNH